MCSEIESSNISMTGKSETLKVHGEKQVKRPVLVINCGAKFVLTCS